MDAVVHFEIPTDDMSRAKKFYEEVFNWNLNDFGGKGEYLMAQTTPHDEKQFPTGVAMIDGALTKRDANSNATVVVMNVDSIEETIKKVVAAGGKELVAKAQVADMGYYAKVVDTEGNIIGIWELIKK